MDNNQYEIKGWVMYDWANSAYSVVVITTFLGPYLTGLIENQGGSITVLGYPIEAEAFFAYCVSLSVILQVIFLPLLGTIADYTPLKKRLLLFFTYAGAISTMFMFFVQSDLILLGGFLFIMANLAFGAAIVFYNAFLPDIVGPDERDSVSSKGFAYGFIGGGLVLLLSILLFGVMADRGLAVRICLAFAGLWWLVFTLLFTQPRLIQRPTLLHLPAGANFLTHGFKEFLVSLKEMATKYPLTLRYLIAALIYNDGIQTIIVVSTIFGAGELGLGPQTLVQVVLMIQLVAAGGALLFNRLARRIGTKSTIMITLLIWCVIVMYAYTLLHTALEFWILGFMVATVLGSSQALSRSLFSQMVPKSREATYFGIYEISSRGTAWVGPLVFALAVQFTGSSRLALLPLIAFFIIGLIILYLTNVRQGIREAGNEVPVVV
jgi:UMF1 family MFS transporter